MDSNKNIVYTVQRGEFTKKVPHGDVDIPSEDNTFLPTDIVKFKIAPSWGLFDVTDVDASDVRVFDVHVSDVHVADIHVSDELGQQPTHAAAATNQPEALAALISGAADVDAQDNTRNHMCICLLYMRSVSGRHPPLCAGHATDPNSSPLG